jgi:hypothetical protein
MDKNRKTGVPVKNLPSIVEWLLANCENDEIEFMAALSSKRTDFTLLNRIFTRLTDFNIHEVFYTNFSNSEELQVFRASKRGEVAGLKAFSMACQAAFKTVQERKSNK